MTRRPPALLFVLFLALALVAIFLSRRPGSIATVWFANAVAIGFGPWRRILLSDRLQEQLHDVEIEAAAGSFAVAIGPEGGFEELELSLAERAGYRPVRLGARVLRTETAGLAALAALQATVGDYR